MTSIGDRDYDREATDQPAHAYAFEFDCIMHEFMMRTFRPMFAGKSALELGCYHGNFTRLLCAQFGSVDVVDASSECIRLATAAVDNGADFHHCRFDEFRPARKFENIFLIHTLEHLDQRVAGLSQMASWLAPAGRMFIATPNAHAGSRQIAVAMGIIDRPTAITEAERAHGHTLTYTLESLEREAREAGLSIESKGGIFFKALANFQIDKALEAGIISPEYLEGCYMVGSGYPDLCSSIYLVCSHG
ncbi:MAG: class I SAM-dependent methyltransferase [Betaproteobacteria bacterium]